MTRHEADRVHEASGIAFTFAGHLVWGNPKLAEGLHGDIEAWRCGRCHALVVGSEDETGTHAEQHVAIDALDSRLSTLALAFDQLTHGAFKPIEAVPGAVLSDQSKAEPKAARQRRNPSATAREMGADVERQTRVARWRDAAAVREVTAEQLRADGLPE